ncbi:MAG TPA: prolyl oligopeptidase family serine peptidase [Blastocatellia bacterium]|nr:prolyl oligopeptidase family serine peptidase [Blastocatellia bacterium]HMY72806.1 prolyl oligopeptidase family serine peptidase [Blastocatellia bacterium]HNG34460.1 prolyl oligopeptidase family serine peptidase [Blastocatellia bacterium]
MRKRVFAFVAAFVLASASLQSGAQQAQTPSRSASGYLMPPKVIVDILDAPPTPGVMLTPDRRAVALLARRSMPTVADLAEPIHRLAGARINPKTNGRQQRGGGITGITLKSIADGTEKKISVPPNSNISGVSFSPDGKRLSFTNTKDNGIELWVADVATGQSKLISGTDRLNGTMGDPCDWLKDNVTLLCQLVPTGRGPAPVAPAVPTGPNIQENYGKAAPAPTVQDLLKTEHDEALFDYYFTSQLAAIDSATGRKTPIGRPGILSDVTASPSGEYILISRIKRPFSRLVPMGGFPNEVEIWNRRGEVARKIADVPSSEGIPMNGTQTGPRGIRWRPDAPATITWVEALDNGNLKNNVPHRDKIVALAAPFSAAPSEVAKTEWRFGGLSYTEAGLMLLSESDRATRRIRTWILESGAAPRKLWERRQQDAYGNPGNPVTKRDGGGGGRGGGFGGFGGGGLILQRGNSIYLTGQGSSPEGDRPFLDRLDLKTLKTERLFRCADKTYETVVGLLDDDAKTILTEAETPTDAPNYFVRDLSANSKRAITQFKDPAPQFAGVEKQFVTYERKDGVKLSGTLYLPPGYKKGERVPMIMWAYPREFTDADTASQVSGSPYRFTRVSGISHLFLLTQGYAIFDNPTMPIVGAGETANDHYIDQLVASAEAAVNKVVEMGVADRDRIGVGGHSYGAFMTANLLAHSDLFRAGIARSGAYNRTLTPFGFQAERRTFWEVPDVYAKMSPFWYANKVNEPILLIHGEADDNSGTFPIQSERFYMALKGHGATVRYVTLPYEAHAYTGRESVMHTLAEMINWADKYVKNAGPRQAARAGN